MEEEDVICVFAESCTQKLVSCGHQRNHKATELNTVLLCTDEGYCAVAEIECKCVGVI